MDMEDSRVKKAVIALLCLCLFDPGSVIASPAAYRLDGPVLTVTNYPELLEIPTDGWLALIYQTDQWQLVPTSVKAVIGNPALDPWVTQIVSSSGGYVLLRANNLTPGPVKIIGGTQFYTQPVGRTITDRCASGGLPCKSRYQLGNKMYEIEFVAVGETESMPPHHGKVILRMLHPQQVEQEIFSIAGPVMDFWRLPCIGDLDNDGKLDVIFEGDDTREAEASLFLSSEAKSEKLVGRVQPFK